MIATSQLAGLLRLGSTHCYVANASVDGRNNLRTVYLPLISIWQLVTRFKSSMSPARAVCRSHQLTIREGRRLLGVFQPHLFLKRNSHDYLLPERFCVNQVGRQQYDVISAPLDSQPSKELDVRFSAFCCARWLGLAASVPTAHPASAR